MLRKLFRLFSNHFFHFLSADYLYSKYYFEANIFSRTVNPLFLQWKTCFASLRSLQSGLRKGFTIQTDLKANEKILKLLNDMREAFFHLLSDGSPMARVAIVVIAAIAETRVASIASALALLRHSRAQCHALHVCSYWVIHHFFLFFHLLFLFLFNSFYNIFDCFVIFVVFLVWKLFCFSCFELHFPIEALFCFRFQYFIRFQSAIPLVFAFHTTINNRI